MKLTAPQAEVLEAIAVHGPCSATRLRRRGRLKLKPTVQLRVLLDGGFVGVDDLLEPPLWHITDRGRAWLSDHQAVGDQEASSCKA